MKHIHLVTMAPRKAEVWQEFVCSINQFMADGLSVKGGASPFLTIIEDKCDLPTAS